MRPELLTGLRAKEVLRVFVAAIGLVAVVVTAVAMGEGGYLERLTAIPYPRSEPARAILFVALNYAYPAIILAAILLLGLRPLGLGWTAIGFRRCEHDWIVCALLLAVLLNGVDILVHVAFVAFDQTWLAARPFADDRAVLATGSAGLIAAHLIAICVATPVAQEAFLRGVLFGWLRRHTHFVVAAAACAIVFGPLHVEWARFGALIVFGLIAAWLFERSRSLWPPIAFHAVFNVIYVVRVLDLPLPRPG